VNTPARGKEHGGKDRGGRIAAGIGAPTLFAVAMSSVGASVYLVLGAVTREALGLTPLVFLVVVLFFVAASMTYIEGSSVHPERGGAATFARYAFNEAWSFVAGWAILLDYLIVMALAAVAVGHYAAGLWGGTAAGPADEIVAVAVIAAVALVNARGFSADRLRPLVRLVLLNVAFLGALAVVGLVLVFHAGRAFGGIEVGAAPTWGGLAFALGMAAVAVMGVEAATGLAGEVRPRGPELRRAVVAAGVSSLVVLVGVSLVAVAALPAAAGTGAVSERFLAAPMVEVALAFPPTWLGAGLRAVVAVLGATVLVLAVNTNMLGVSRLTYSLATYRQIPSGLGRLHATRSTPTVAIFGAAAIAAGLALTASVRLLLGVFAFGSMLGFAIAFAAVIRLRFTEAAAPRVYRVPGSIPVGRGSVPVPTALAALVAAGVAVSVLALNDGALIVGSLWIGAGLVLYVANRRAGGSSLTARSRVPAEALQEAPDLEYGSILVPVFGRSLDDDIVGTAGRLAADELEQGEGGPMIEALYVLEIPVSLPIEARVPDTQVDQGKRALARAKEVGEEYEGVEVATALVRGRSAGAAIVSEARRRGVEAIVLAAEEPTRVRGGGRLGGRGAPADRFIGETTKYVVEKAPCRVILTAPATEDRPREVASVNGDGGAAPPAEAAPDQQ
jgi:APA family basic amino acid/polyamine antiporter